MSYDQRTQIAMSRPTRDIAVTEDWSNAQVFKPDHINGNDNRNTDDDDDHEALSA